MKCDPSEIEQKLHSTRCPLNALESSTYIDISTIPLTFKERDGRSLKQCGPIHSPGGPNGIDYHISDYPFATPYWSNRNYESRSTSSQYLCSRHEWSQGDYRDNAIIGNETSPDTDQGLQIGRHIRVNYNNYNRKPNSQKWAIGDTEPGEEFLPAIMVGVVSHLISVHVKMDTLDLIATLRYAGIVKTMELLQDA